MAKKSSGDSVYKVVELVGTSSKSWEDAAKNAVETAAGSLRDLRVAEIVKQDMTVENGKVAAYRARVLVSFKYGNFQSGLKSSSDRPRSPSRTCRSRPGFFDRHRPAFRPRLEVHASLSAKNGLHSRPDEGS